MRQISHLVLATALWMASATVAAAQIMVTNSTQQERLARPGETYVGTIRLRNTTDQPQEVRLTQVDYGFDASGQVWFDAAGTRARSNASWVRPAQEVVTLAPAATEEVRYTVSVPDSAALAGTYWSVILVSGTPAPSADAEAVQIRVATRYAVEVATHIQRTGEQAVLFRDLALESSSEGGRALRFDVHNTGERSARLRISLSLYDPEGGLVGQKEQQRGLLYPATSLRQSFDLSDIPPGSYRAVILADTGEEDAFVTEYTLAL